MQIFREIRPFRAFLVGKQMERKSIGFVPTMGALHEGHLALLNASKSQNIITVCSIYINPTQFNNAADLANYPRSIEKDTSLLESVGCDAVFIPDNLEMYNGESRLRFDFGHLEAVMEGKHRPGHFNGVALVVSKLLNIVSPTRAYFGQKDWQQCCRISHLVDELKFNVEVCVVPTVREESGLAMSSRNFRLNEEQRRKAVRIHDSLIEARQQLLNGVSVSQVKKMVEKKISAAHDMRLEYFELASSANLNLLQDVDESAKPIMCIAAFVGEVRLIDNMFLFENQNS